MDRARKKKELEELSSTLSGTGLVLVSHNKGMTVAQVTELRRTLRSGGAAYKVTKNTLTRRAVQGTKFEGVSDLLVGPTGLTTTGGDPMVAIKTAYDIAKKFDGKLVFTGGMMGDMKLDAAAVEKLAKLPSLDQLRATIVGLLQAPAAQLARLADGYAKKGAA